jgi:DNA modification methylase
MSNIKISDLTPDNKNYNKGSEFGNSLIEKSLRKFGAGRSILIDKNNRIIAGNKTIENAGAIGLDDIIVVETTGNQIVAVKRMDIDLDSKQGRELALADNASAKANINWDFETINFDWNETEIKEWGLEIPDFEVLEAEEDDFAVPDGGTETDIVLGDLFEIGEHRLLCGDSTDSDQVAKLMNGQKADMVFTDPPYNVAYEGGSKKRDAIANDKIDNFYQFLYDTYVNCYLVMRDGAPIYVAHSELERINFTLAFLDAGFKFSSLICWVKNNSTFSMNKDYKQKHEPIIYGWKQGGNHTWVGGNCEDTVWEIKRPSKSELHPTMKPIELCERGIKNSSNQDAIVYEPFTGSGSTMVASHQLKRKCYGMELDAKYCQVIVDRMQKLDSTLIIKKNGVPL